MMLLNQKNQVYYKMNINIKNILKFACCLLVVGTIESMLVTGEDKLVECIIVFVGGSIISFTVLDWD